MFDEEVFVRVNLRLVFRFVEEGRFFEVLGLRVRGWGVRRGGFSNFSVCFVFRSRVFF